MKYSILVLAFATATILAVAAAQDKPPAQAQKSEKAKEPPLLLDDDPPLLLDDDEGPSTDNKKMADNSRCHVCHLNFADEPLALVHAKANLGCTECHGNCDEHIADESWATGGNGTPPGKMYLRKDIDECCRQCHKRHDVSPPKIIALWQKRREKKPPPLGVDLKTLPPEKIVCTDCHGDHHMYLEKRKCKWK